MYFLSDFFSKKKSKIFSKGLKHNYWAFWNYVGRILLFSEYLRKHKNFKFNTNWWKFSSFSDVMFFYCVDWIFLQRFNLWTFKSLNWKIKANRTTLTNFNKQIKVRWKCTKTRFKHVLCYDFLKKKDDFFQFNFRWRMKRFQDYLL